MKSFTVSRSAWIPLIALCLLFLFPGFSYADIWYSGGSNTGLFRAESDGSNRETLISNARVWGIAVTDSYVYWADNSGSRISRANLDGTNPNLDFITGLTGVYGVAVRGNNLYWTISAGSIGRANLDGSNVNSSFITGLGSALNYLAVNDAYIYGGRAANGANIVRANIDGTGINTAFMSVAGRVGGLALSSSQLYWGSYDGTHGRANLDGTNPITNTLFGVVSTIAFDNDKLFVRNNGGEIYSTPADISTSTKIMTSTGFGFGIAALLEPPPTVSSLSPISGSNAGGTSVTVTGTGFNSSTTAAIGGVPCVVSGTTTITSLTCTTGASTAGSASVVVTNSDNKSGSLVNGYTYLSPQTITFTSPADVPISVGTVLLTASASSGLAVSYSSTNSSVCTVSGNTVSLLFGGTCSITGSQDGDSTWAAAPPVTQSFQVNAVVPAAPTLATVVNGNRQATLAFTAPSNNGGSVITNYEYSINNGLTWTTRSPSSSASPVVITGLTNGTSYQVTLRAVNSVGSGAASAFITATPFTVPDAPNVGKAIAGNGQASIAFTAPASSGGSPITGYTVTCTSSDGGVTSSASGSDSPITVVGMTNGKSYVCTVSAANNAGLGAASASSNVFIPQPSVSQENITTRQNGITATLAAVGCTAIDRAMFLDAPATGKPARTSFPLGLLDFRLSGCSSSATVTVTYSQAVPNGAVFYKENSGTYSTYPATLNANAVTFTLTDNGAGDANPASGVIDDPSGFGVPELADVLAVPTLAEWSLIILSSLMATFGMFHVRRQRVRDL